MSTLATLTVFWAFSQPVVVGDLQGMEYNFQAIRVELDKGIEECHKVGKKAVENISALPTAKLFEKLEYSCDKQTLS